MIVQYLQLIAITANSYNEDLNSSMIGNIIPLIEYTLLFPNMTSQSNLFFNYAMLAIGLGVSLFLVWGIFYVFNAPN